MQKLEWLNFEAWVSFASFDSIWDLKAEPFSLIQLSSRECKFAVFQIG